MSFHLTQFNNFDNLQGMALQNSVIKCFFDVLKFVLMNREFVSETRPFNITQPRPKSVPVPEPVSCFQSHYVGVIIAQKG